MKLMHSIKHELSLFAAATVFAVVCALAWGSPFVGTASASSSHSQSQVFQGTLIQSGAQILLRDSSGQIFRLDNSVPAQAYLGQTVTVTGQVDASSKRIHLQRIHAQGA